MKVDESVRFKSFLRRDVKGCLPIIDEINCRASKSELEPAVFHSILLSLQVQRGRSPEGSD